MGDYMKKRYRLTKKQKLWTALMVLAFLLIVFSAIAVISNFRVIIHLNGEPEVTVEYGGEYTEPGAEAWFVRVLKQHSEPVKVTVTGQVDTDRVGSYQVKYHASYKTWKKTVVRTVRVVDTVAPQIVLIEKPGSYTLPGHPYQEEGFTAIDNYDGDITERVVCTVDGGYVTYTVQDSSGNATVVQRKIVYKDPEGPRITLKGGKNMTVTLGNTYTEPGFEAIDNADGNITDQVKVTGQVNSDKEGTYTIKYTVTDAFGNKTTEIRTVTVRRREDGVKPQLTLKGDMKIILTVGDTYVEPGYTATDDMDGDITAQVQLSGTVNTAVAGTYAIRYMVKDSYGNENTVFRTIIVRKQGGTKPGTGKVIYLTFDDGPSSYTNSLLNTLKKYNAKATFFVVDTRKYEPMKTMAAHGHTVAIHTATHVFKEIYASETAYFNDLYKMQNIIHQHTGQWSTLLRFPGGSSNGVSKFNPGIMTRLTKAVEEKGFTYFDWNVDSMDAGGAKTASAVYNNVIKGCQKVKNPVVLMHDIKKYSVEAVEEILKWGTANGYTFEALTADSPVVHHKILN